MFRQKFLPKVLNLLMLSALFYLSVIIVKCINSEMNEPEKINKTQIPSNEITKNKIFNYLKNEEVKNTLYFNLDFSKINFNNLTKNISLSVFLTSFIIWGKLLPTGTV